jgi:hypothetical protein
MNRPWRLASWAIPPLFLLALYWPGLRCWFRQDDFAWLQLRGTIHTWADFWRAMFAPMAQGTIRPWSERAFFIGFYSLFGLNALPFRICAFVTQVANLTLIRAVGERITGSSAAGFWAALLWTANSVLIPVMTWSSVYNQALCGFFLLLAFYFLLRYIETGDSRFQWAQWAAFLLGFGALEIMVVYPALAAVYTLLCARRYFRGTLPLFLPSIAFTIVHRAVSPPVAGSPYAMSFDSSLFITFLRYLMRAAAPPGIWPVCAVSILLALAAFAATQALRGKSEALFLAAWFAIVLGPVLPLRNHFSEYYLTLPSMGLGMLGGWGLAAAWKARPVWKVAALALLAIYCIPLPSIRAQTKARYRLSRDIEGMVLGVVEVRQLHPGRIILLTGLSDELFWNAVLDRPFKLVGVSDVYISPESGQMLTPHPDIAEIRPFVLPPADTLDGLNAGRIVVYAPSGDRLRNVTSLYQTTMRLYLHNTVPRRVDVADDLLSYLLGKTWYPRDEKHRWMPKQASLRLGGPVTSQQRLYLTGYCPKQQWEKGPLPLSVTVDGAALPPVRIQPGNERFAFDFALPRESAGKESVEVAVEVGRTFTPPGEDRALGLVFGVFEIR